MLLDVRDNKAEFVLELLRSFSFVKASPITPYKAHVLEGLKDAVDQVNLAKQGKIKLKSVRQLFG